MSLDAFHESSGESDEDDSVLAQGLHGTGDDDQDETIGGDSSEPFSTCGFVLG